MGYHVAMRLLTAITAELTLLLQCVLTGTTKSLRGSRRSHDQASSRRTPMVLQRRLFDVLLLTRPMPATLLTIWRLPFQDLDKSFILCTVYNTFAYLSPNSIRSSNLFKNLLKTRSSTSLRTSPRQGRGLFWVRDHVRYQFSDKVDLMEFGLYLSNTHRLRSAVWGIRLRSLYQLLNTSRRASKSSGGRQCQ